MNKLYSVHDHWTNINKKNDVDIESIDGVITGIKVNGEDYGGGTSWTEVFSGDVVTSGEAAPFSGTINAVLSGADTIKVFYNDGVYILPLQVTDDGMFYGANPSGYPDNIDFSEIPFLIKLDEVSTALYTQSPGPQDLTILEPQSGGGENDFSTAEVTIINNSGGEYYFSLMTEYDGTDYYISALFNNGGHYYGEKEFDMNDGETATFEFIALEPSFKLSANDSAVATGDCVIEFDDNSESYVAIITGDCTITIGGGE